MKRDDLIRAIDAACLIIQQDKVIIIGSQSILGSYTEDQLPPRVTQSTEVDIRPLTDDESESLADKLDAAAGEMSDFHTKHDFYIQGVGKKTATLPQGWEDRLIPVRGEYHNHVGYCLDPHDLCAAKLIANRDKDREFVIALINSGHINPVTISERLRRVNDGPHTHQVQIAQHFLSIWVTPEQHTLNPSPPSPTQNGLGF